MVRSKEDIEANTLCLLTNIESFLLLDMGGRDIDFSRNNASEASFTMPYLSLISKLGMVLKTIDNSIMIEGWS